MSRFIKKIMSKTLVGLLVVSFAGVSYALPGRKGHNHPVPKEKKYRTLKAKDVNTARNPRYQRYYRWAPAPQSKAKMTESAPQDTAVR